MQLLEYYRLTLQSSLLPSPEGPPVFLAAPGHSHA